MVQVSSVVVQVPPAGLEMTVYPVIGVPPVELALQVTAVCGFEPLATLATLVAVPMAGVLGAVAGVTLLEAAEAEPVPAPLVAVTENVYAVPAVRPEVMVQVVALATEAVQVPPAGLEVAV
jgi:hypothetical protein